MHSRCEGVLEAREEVAGAGVSCGWGEEGLVAVVT